MEFAYRPELWQAFFETGPRGFGHRARGAVCLVWSTYNALEPDDHCGGEAPRHIVTSKP